MPDHLLLVEDDGLVRSLIAARLEDEGYGVTAVGSGKEMFEAIESKEFNLVVLDLGLPDEDGIVLARKLRARSSVPLIILTGRREKEYRLSGLELGADDYVEKSDNFDELLLRVRNLLHRSKYTSVSSRMERDPRKLQFCGWTIDLSGFALYSPEGEQVTLTPYEFNVLAFLVRNNGRVVSRSSILDAVSKHEDSASDRMIDSFVSRIRKKIERVPSNPQIIITVSGVGYKINC